MTNSRPLSAVLDAAESSGKLNPRTADILAALPGVSREALRQASTTAARPGRSCIAQPPRNPYRLAAYPSTSSPFRSTRFRSFNEVPLGDFWPRSHFCTVEILVFRYAAKTA